MNKTAMSRLLCVFITGLMLIGWMKPTNSSEALVIITNEKTDVQELTLNQVKKIFLRTNLLDSAGNAWLPVNLPLSHELRLTFSQEMFQQRPEQLEYYWNKMYFQGINPPDILQSEEAVLRFVAITPNAIGYVHLHNVNEYVKIVKLINIP